MCAVEVNKGPGHYGVSKINWWGEFSQGSVTVALQVQSWLLLRSSLLTWTDRLHSVDCTLQVGDREAVSAPHFSSRISPLISSPKSEKNHTWHVVSCCISNMLSMTDFWIQWCSGFISTDLVCRVLRFLYWHILGNWVIEFFPGGSENLSSLIASVGKCKWLTSDDRPLLQHLQGWSWWWRCRGHRRCEGYRSLRQCWTPSLSYPAATERRQWQKGQSRQNLFRL